MNVRIEGNDLPVLNATSDRTSYQPEFKAFPKIPRYKRYFIITEKIDGTNAAVIVTAEGTVHAQSRKRIITPNTSGQVTDNFGFAEWVQNHEDELRELGEGYHYGEWWGVGINRGYGLSERRFSLFNTARWTDDTPPPTCCHVVPILCADHSNLDNRIEEALHSLRHLGSTAAMPDDKRRRPFMQPEGVVVYHTAAGNYFKVLLEGDELPKGVTTQAERQAAQL